MMRHLIISVVSLLIPYAVWAAETEPRLSVDLPEGDVIVGQPLTLRMKLLVPSWMPKPPVWPTLEVPSLLVRLPERASTPVSETIEGETWSGISRAYRLYPLEIGAYAIPGQSLVVTFADPGKPGPIVTELALDPILFEAVLPKGATDLDPPVVATGLTLEQQIEGGPDIVTGDAITRTIKVSVSGTTPILIPALLPDLPLTDDETPPPLRAYPKEPKLDQSEQRGVMSGNRVEEATYVAQGGGSVVLAPISLDWFNLDSGTVETATLDGVTLTIAAPPPPPPSSADYVRWAVLGIIILIGIWAAFRFLIPRSRLWLDGLRKRWHDSERYARHRVKRALRAQDLNATMGTLEHWAQFKVGFVPEDNERLSVALAQIGAAQYGPTGHGDAKQSWAEATQAFGELSGLARHKTVKTTLPELNPLGS